MPTETRLASSSEANSVSTSTRSLLWHGDGDVEAVRTIVGIRSLRTSTCRWRTSASLKKCGVVPVCPQRSRGREPQRMGILFRVGAQDTFVQ